MSADALFMRLLRSGGAGAMMSVVRAFRKRAQPPDGYANTRSVAESRQKMPRGAGVDLF